MRLSDKFVGWFLPGSIGSAWPRFILALLFLGLAMKVATLAFMMDVQLIGDEVYYNRSAAKLGELITGEHSRWGHTLQWILVRSGWFMPGTSFLLLPVYLIDDSPSLLFLRSWVSGFTFILLLFAMREAHRAFGPAAAAALVVASLLNPGLQVLNASLLGDAPAGLLIVIIAARLFVMTRDLIARQRVGIADLLILEALMIAMVYFRGNTILIVFAVHIFLIAIGAFSNLWKEAASPASGFRPFLGFAGKTVFGIAVFASLLAPWSLTASHYLKAPVLTTSTLNLSLGVAFGDREKLCLGSCGEVNNIWVQGAQFARKTAEATGESRLEVERRMMEYATEGLTLSEYLQKVSKNLERFTAGPQLYAWLYLQHADNEWISEKKASIYFTGIFPTAFIYFSTLGLLLLANIWVTRQSRDAVILSLIVKMMTLCIFSQILVHPSWSRYWPTFAPLMAIAGVFIFKLLYQTPIAFRAEGNSRSGVAERNDGPARAFSPTDWVLYGIQGLYSLVVVIFLLSLAAI